MAKRRIKEVEGQIGLPFGEKGTKPGKRERKRKGLSLAERRVIKANALMVAKQAYAIIMSPQAAEIFQGVNPQHIEHYRKEFGMDIGALKNGRMYTPQALAVIGRAKSFFDRFGIKHKA